VTQRIEREIVSLGFEFEVLLVWRRGGEIVDERRGFKRWERTRSRRPGDRGHEFVALYAWEAARRDWHHVWRSEWPTHFVQAGPPVPAPRIVRPALEAPPDILPDRIAAVGLRAIRAFQVDRALPDRERDWLKVRAYGLITRPGPGDFPPEQITRDRPTRREISDYLVMMPLIARLEADEIRLLRLRSFGLSFRSIAERIRTHEQTARERYRTVLHRLAALADRLDAEAPRPGA